MQKEFVLDSSVTMAWFFKDEDSRYAARVKRSLIRAEPLVPSLWHLEVANTLLVGIRSKRANAELAMEFVQFLDSLPLTTDDYLESYGLRDIFSLAYTLDLTPYDATYIELAKRRDLPLATLDKELQRAAKVAGVKLYKP